MRQDRVGGDLPAATVCQGQSVQRVTMEKPHGACRLEFGLWK